MGTIDGTEWSNVTIDGTEVKEITMDGNVVWRAGPEYPSGMISHLEFEQDLSDSTGNYSYSDNGVSYATDSVQGDYSVDVSNGYAENSSTPMTNNIGSSYSIAGWMKAANGDEGGYIYQEEDFGSSYDRIAFGDDSGDLKHEHRSSGGGYTNCSISTNHDDGSWHHVVSTWDGGTIRLYMDGSKLGSESLRDSVGDPIESRVGYDWNGLIDDVCLFDRQLSDSEISNFYSSY